MASVSGSGAYAVVIDPPNNLLDNTFFTRVVPLPPAGNTGVVDYEPVFLSVAVAGPNLPVTLSVSILRPPASPQLLGPFTFGAGRHGIVKVSPGDAAAEIGFTPTGAPNTAVTAVTAFVEYGTP